MPSNQIPVIGHAITYPLTNYTKKQFLSELQTHYKISEDLQRIIHLVNEHYEGLCYNLAVDSFLN